MTIPATSIPSFAGAPNTAIPTLPSETPILGRRVLSPPERFEYQPSSRWVRGVLGNTAIVDSRHQLLVWEPGAKGPAYAYPLAHVRTDLLVPSTAGDEASAAYFIPKTEFVQWFDLVLGEGTIPRAAWKYAIPGLEDFIAVSWHTSVLDKWYEEDEVAWGAARDQRIDLVPTKRHVVVKVGGAVVADTTGAIALFERGYATRFYIPAQDVRIDLLEPVELKTVCPFKGQSSYFKVKGTEDPIAWFYPEPILSVEPIKNHVAFWNERVELIVDGEAFADSPKVWA
ncbi:hypothetical protein Q8F55_004689 [Vanrija albida]|uniref:DUF427 domain-containing protein n=1 Tax=Vanrija albida TaxID=181172 RepID=A0ABR3Q7F8_9TREE